MINVYLVFLYYLRIKFIILFLLITSKNTSLSQLCYQYSFLLIKEGLFILFMRNVSYLLVLCRFPLFLLILFQLFQKKYQYSKYLHICNFQIHVLSNHCIIIKINYSNYVIHYSHKFDLWLYYEVYILVSLELCFMEINYLTYF